MAKYLVKLHAHAAAEVYVEAENGREANLLARAAMEAGKSHFPIRKDQWTPTMTINLDRKF